MLTARICCHYFLNQTS